MNFKMSEETVLSIDPWGTCGSHSGLPSRVDRWWPALEHLVTVGPVQSGAPFWDRVLFIYKKDHLQKFSQRCSVG